MDILSNGRAPRSADLQRRRLRAPACRGRRAACAAQRRAADGSTVLAEYYAHGARSAALQAAEGDGRTFYTRDHLGSIREVTGVDGQVRARYDYDPWGRIQRLPLTAANPADLGYAHADFAFTGHFLHRKSGLHLALYRAYDAELGRWLSTDPIAEDGGLNLYGYVDNAPVDWWDELGLMPGLEPLANQTGADGLPTRPNKCPNGGWWPWQWGPNEWAAFRAGMRRGWSKPGGARDQMTDPGAYGQAFADRATGGASRKMGIKKKGKKKTSRRSGKERASDLPSWAGGISPVPGKTPAQQAADICKKRFPDGFKRGPTSPYNQIKKYLERY